MGVNSWLEPRISLRRPPTSVTEAPAGIGGAVCAAPVSAAQEADWRGRTPPVGPAFLLPHVGPRQPFGGTRRDGRNAHRAWRRCPAR